MKLFDEVFDRRWGSFDYFKKLDAAHIVAMVSANDLESLPIKTANGDMTTDSCLQSGSPQVDLQAGLEEGSIQLNIGEDKMWNYQWRLVERNVRADDIDKLLSTQRLDLRSRMTIQSLLDAPFATSRSWTTGRSSSSCWGRPGAGSRPF